MHRTYLKWLAKTENALLGKRGGLVETELCGEVSVAIYKDIQRGGRGLPEAGRSFVGGSLLW